MCEELDKIYERRWKDEVFPPVLLEATLKFDSNVWDRLSVRVHIPDCPHAIAGWNINRMPALAVVYNAYVAYQYQGKGIGKFLSLFRVASFHEMKAGDCDKIEQICHVAPSNKLQQHILRAVGWEQLSATIWRVKSYS